MKKLWSWLLWIVFGWRDESVSAEIVTEAPPEPFFSGDFEHRSISDPVPSFRGYELNRRPACRTFRVHGQNAYEASQDLVIPKPDEPWNVRGFPHIPDEYRLEVEAHRFSGCVWRMTVMYRPKASVDYPEHDATDGAHPAWWRGNDHAVFSLCQMINEILDGKDHPGGASNEPWESTRRRIRELVAKANPPTEWIQQPPYDSHPITLTPDLAKYAGIPSHLPGASHADKHRDA